MKKLLLLFALVAGFACSVKAEDKVTAKVSGTSLNIGLENETTFCAFQMDITLPTGVSASKIAAAANRLSQTGSDTEVGGTKFIVASNVLDGNVLRVIAYNLANAEIANATGDILNITLDSAVADPSKIKVTNILFVSKEKLKDVTIDDATGENGSTGVRGDLTGDGKVDVEDVGVALKISLKLADYSEKADLTGDGKVDVEDVGVILKISLKLAN